MSNSSGKRQSTCEAVEPLGEARRSTKESVKSITVNLYAFHALLPVEEVTATQ
jgi:hypothetical protein